MLEARLKEARPLKALLEAIKELVTECNLDCNDAGISLQAMDNSHVALVSMLMRTDAFDPYRCDRNLPLGVNLGSLCKIMKTSKNDDILSLKAEDSGDKLSLVFEAKDTSKISEYEMKLMDIDSEHLGIPETEYDATVTMSAARFQEICRDLMGITETVNIECVKDSIKFSSEGDFAKAGITLKAEGAVDDDEGVAIELKSSVMMTFSLKYLVNFTKATPLSKRVSINLSSEVPMMVEYKLGDNEGSGHLRYYLAPKIGDD